jgi:transposase
MLKPEEVMTIEVLSRRGAPIKAIVTATGMSRNTVRKYVRAEGAEVVRKPYKRRMTKLDEHEAWLREWAPKVKYNAWRLHLDLVREKGYKGCYDTVKTFVRRLRPAGERKAFTRVETPPGLQAQADFGEAWVEIGGKLVKRYVFLFTLSFSRRMAGVWMSSQDLLHTLWAHRVVLEKIGGLVEIVRYDNMSTAVKEGAGPTAVLNETFARYIRAWGIAAEFCHAASPHEKGKVESGVGYVKGSFVPGRKFSSDEDLQAQFDAWVATVADVRIHGTTGRRPVDMFEEEKPRLKPLPAVRPEPLEPFEARVYKDCLFSFEGNRYSVPHPFANRTVRIEATLTHVRAYADGRPIAAHARSQRGARAMVIAEEHYEGIFKARGLALAKSAGELPAAPEPAPMEVPALALGRDHVLQHVQQRSLSEYEKLAEVACE